MVFRDVKVEGKFERRQMIRKGTRFLGYYKNGYAYNTFWVGMLGGTPYAHLHGSISERKNGRISGDNMSYIYPDMETAFVGRFDNRIMIDAKHAKVSRVDCDENGLPYVSEFIKESSEKFYYDPPNNISFGADPEYVPDPYENTMLSLRPSNIPNSGEGVFIKKDVKKGMVLALYTGFRYDEEQQKLYEADCAYNISKTNDERRHCLKYAISIPSTRKKINIPPELDNPCTFFPTLGPKVIYKYNIFTNVIIYNNKHILNTKARSTRIDTVPGKSSFLSQQHKF